MRRKIVRNERVAAKNRIATLTLITIALSCIAVIAVCLVLLVKQYDAYKIVWDSQNECIADTIRMGVERKHIARDGNTCIILGETNEDL
jgi:type IV secretory pathway component VirB8